MVVQITESVWVNVGDYSPAHVKLSNLNSNQFIDSKSLDLDLELKIFHVSIMPVHHLTNIANCSFPKPFWCLDVTQEVPSQLWKQVKIK